MNVFLYSEGGEEYVSYSQEYVDDLKEEITRLKAREEECMNAYLRATKYASEMEGKYVVDEYIINQLEKFFKYEYDNEVRPLNDRKISVWTICLDKLKELKEGSDKE